MTTDSSARQPKGIPVGGQFAATAHAQAAIAAREEALKDPKFKKRQRFRDDRDPDLNYKGEPTYNGFEYFLMSADGKETLEDMWGNSKGDTQGCYEPETYDYDVHKLGRVIPQLKLKTEERMKRAKEDIAKYEADIDAVKNGTYGLGGYGVPSWSSRLDLAEKAANQYAGWTRRVSVLPVDQ